MVDYKNTIDFIKSVYGNKEFTPLAVPVFAGNEKAYLNECIDTTFVSSVGKFVDRFEEDMAKYTGAKRAVVCVSGTNALHMSLILAGVKKDDEVLTQALTFIATCNALSYIGAHPVFLDVDFTTMGLSPDAMKEWLQANAEVRKNTRIDELPASLNFAFHEDELACYNKYTGRRIKACVPMHTFGHPVRIDEIAVLCKEWHIELVEDAAESIGSTSSIWNIWTHWCYLIQWQQDYHHWWWRYDALHGRGTRSLRKAHYHTGQDSSSVGVSSRSHRFQLPYAEYQCSSRLRSVGES